MLKHSYIMKKTLLSETLRIKEMMGLSFMTEQTDDTVLVIRDGMSEGRIEKSEEVREMQQLLMDRNYMLPRFGVDGKFGPETLSAVEAFQKDYGTSVTGEVTGEMMGLLKNEENVNKNPEINDPITVSQNITKGHVTPWDSTVMDAIKSASYNNGVDIDLMMTIAKIESDGNPQARNKRSGASGLYQIMPKYFKDYGVSSTTVWDPYINADAGAKGLIRKIKGLKKVLGRTPTNSQVYMAHNQGKTGFSIIYNACNKFGNLDGKESLQNSSTDLGYSRSFGNKIYSNMRGNKGNHPCQFMKSWDSIYATKSSQVPSIT